MCTAHDNLMYCYFLSSENRPNCYERQAQKPEIATLSTNTVANCRYHDIFVYHIIASASGIENSNQQPHQLLLALPTESWARDQCWHIEERRTIPGKGKCLSTQREAAQGSAWLDPCLQEQTNTHQMSPAKFLRTTLEICLCHYPLRDKIHNHVPPAKKC